MRKLDWVVAVVILVLVAAIVVRVTVDVVIDWREHQQYMQSQVCEENPDETVLQP